MPLFLRSCRPLKLPSATHILLVLHEPYLQIHTEVRSIGLCLRTIRHGLHSSPICARVKPKVTPAKPVPKSARPRPLGTTQSTARRSPAQDTICKSLYARKLAILNQPTILYEGPSGSGYKLGCYAFSSLLFSWSGYICYQNFYLAPSTLWWPIPIFFLVFSGGISVIAVWIALSGTRHLQRIVAVPVSGTDQVVLRLRPKTLIPFWPAMEYTHRPEELSMARRVAEVNKTPASKMIDAERARDIARQPRALQAFSRTYQRQEFARLWVGTAQKPRWRLDTRHGWFMAEGKALDNLVRLRDDPATDRWEASVLSYTR